MNIYKKLERERKVNLVKIYIPAVIMVVAGYFLYALIIKKFFLGWEAYFAIGCYAIILVTLVILEAKIVRWIYYCIYLEDNRVKIRDGIFSRTISIPMDRLYYVSTYKVNEGYDSILITDKKINHKKVSPLSKQKFKNLNIHMKEIIELEERCPDKAFYYYRVFHKGYKFYYYLYMLYKCCENCRFSDVSMELVREYFIAK